MRNMRVRGLFMVALLVSVTVLSVMNALTVRAAQITTRSLTLQASTDGKTGGSAAFGTTAYTSGSNPNHKFTFTLPTAGTVGSVKLEYCTTATGTCTAPTNLTAAGATLGSQTGSAVTFTGITPSAASVVVSRTANAITANSVVVVTLNNVQNPSTIGTFFTRISSFASTDGTGTAIDTGTVAASTANAIPLSGIMPESLIFCAGITVTADCATVTTGTVSFTTLFSPSASSYATSQMAASTNASSGYNITVNGATLTSGTATIPAIAAVKTPSTATSEFGMNLMQNAGVAGSANIAASSNGTTLTGQALTGYNTSGSYKFVSGDSVANSGSGGSAAPTNGQVYTATYMVNVAGIQAAGTYTTTLTYICTPTF